MSGKEFYFLDEHSNSDQADYIGEYLPDDETFEAKMVANTNLRKMLEVFGIQLKSFEEFLNIFTSEMDPSCAVHLIEEWERMLGIPDECFSNTVTLEERQRNALIKLAKMSIQTTQDFQNLAESFGITATVESGIDFVLGGGAPFPGGDAEARFTIVITFLGGETQVFPLTFPIVFGNSILAILECIFSKVKPANVNVKFIEIIPEVLGDLYFKLGEPATNPRFTYFGTTNGTLNSDISIGVGDTITFSYTANNTGPSSGENFIESSDGTNFFGWAIPGVSSFAGYTATLNGATINSGDPLPYSDPSNYPVGGARLTHTVVLTAITTTDVRFIGDANIGQPIYDVIIATSGQTWIYPIDSLTVTNEDSNGSGNDLVLSANNFWIDSPVMLNTGSDTNGIAPYFYIEDTDFSLLSNNFSYSAASLRKDSAGGSLATNGSTHWFGSSVENIFLPYKDGIAVEVIAKFNGFVTSSGNACGIVSATSNTFSMTLWTMGFDDYDGSANGSGFIGPQFSLLERNTNYQRSIDFLDNVADIRGDVAVLGNTYHLLATIRPSNRTVEFYVNGVSAGSVSLSQIDFDAWAIPNGAGNSQDVLEGIFPTRFDIGARITDGAWRSGQDSNIQDLKVHLLEADDAFAAQQAANANFT